MPQKDEPKAGAPEWMCTFSDMMSLLLCFFVLLFALSTIEEKKFVQTIGFIKGAFGRVPNMFNMSFIPPINVTPTDAQPTMDVRKIERAMDAIAENFKEKLVAVEQTREVLIRGVEEGFRFEIRGDLLFRPGSAEISDASAKVILDPLSEVLAEFTNRVRIEGHTDNVWDEGQPHFYEDNFDLAAARAYNVLHYMEENPNPALRIAHDRLSFQSLGPNHPAASNDTPEGRQQNRRVSIILLESFKSGSLEGKLDIPENPPSEAPIGDVMPSF
ncbi:MAG: flagellar motor protein MotB [bacterium]